MTEQEIMDTQVVKNAASNFPAIGKPTFICNFIHFYTYNVTGVCIWMLQQHYFCLTQGEQPHNIYLAPHLLSYKPPHQRPAWQSDRKEGLAQAKVPVI